MPALLRRSRHHRTNGRSRGGRKCRWLDLEIPAAASRVAGFNGHRWPAGKIRVQLHFCHLLAYQSVALAEPLPPLELLPPDYSATNQKLHGQITHLISSAIIDHTPVPLERNLATSHVLYPKKKKYKRRLFPTPPKASFLPLEQKKKKRAFHGHVPESVASSQQLIFLWTSLGHLRKEATGASFWSPSLSLTIH